MTPRMCAGSVFFLSSLQPFLLQLRTHFSQEFKMDKIDISFLRLRNHRSKWVTGTPLLHPSSLWTPACANTSRFDTSVPCSKKTRYLLFLLLNSSSCAPPPWLPSSSSSSLPPSSSSHRLQPHTFNPSCIFLHCALLTCGDFIIANITFCLTSWTWKPPQPVWINLIWSSVAAAHVQPGSARG